MLLQTLGVSSLVLLSVGYLAGRYREGTEISNSLIPPLIIGALTIVAATEFAAIQLEQSVPRGGRREGTAFFEFFRDLLIFGVLFRVS